jgi:Flp pilus assembly protein TadG
LLFAIIESALMFLASQVLESASQNSARVLLTGQA